MKLWQDCVKELGYLISEEDINRWIRPLSAKVANNQIKLFAPNKILYEKVSALYLEQIRQVLLLLQKNLNEEPVELLLESKERPQNPIVSYINKEQVFDNFIEGKSNRLARAAAMQVATQPGLSYNPFLIYSGVGLGKTHLLHAIGNAIHKTFPEKRVRYLHSEEFVSNMVDALRNGRMDKFTRYYRGLDVLLIDDVQFFAGKEQSQEEFFHTFNHLFGSQSQIVMTCDRYPKEIDRLEDRLKSRFSSGLTHIIEYPELETRAAIIMSKSKQYGLDISSEISFFIAEKLKSNIRELEGALRRVEASVKITKQPLTILYIEEILKDLIIANNRQVSIENIQKATAEYYNIQLSDLLSSRRSRSVARPRQMAMFLSKELTHRSLPEIGKAFGGRDHTTVLHACRTIKKLKEHDANIMHAYKALVRILN
ncbi:MAG: chromosomal replication initiator protein DnaA [Chromatiales bacterium]|nr:chromosomal replication initiator protein DnaA [Chromatiales bacterium]